MELPRHWIENSREMCVVGQMENRRMVTPPMIVLCRDRDEKERRQERRTLTYTDRQADRVKPARTDKRQANIDRYTDRQTNMYYDRQPNIHK